MPIFRPSSTLNGPSTATVSRLAPIGTHFPVYGENIDYAIRIVEHFMHLLPGVAETNLPEEHQRFIYPGENFDNAVQIVEHFLSTFLHQGKQL